MGTTPSRRLRDARVGLRRARALDEAGRIGEALAAYGRVVAALDGDPRLPARGRTAEALFFQSQALFDLGEADAALALVDGLVARYAAGETALRRRMMHALFATVFTLRTEHPERAETALALCAAAVRLFGDDTDACVRERLLNVLVDQGRILEGSGRTAEGLALADEIRRRYEADSKWRTRAMTVAERMTRRLAAGTPS